MKLLGKQVHPVIAICCLVIWATACRPEFPDDSTTIPTGTVGPPASTEASPVPSPTPESSEYVFASGLRVEYPAGWSFEISSSPGGPESVWFRSVDPRHSDIGLEAAYRPPEQRSVADPYTWMPNEGGYEIHWSKPVTTGELEGLLFVWGVQREGTWDGPPWLMAILYHAARELDIRLTTEFSAAQLETANNEGLEEAVSVAFVEFNQMIASLSLVSEPGSVSLTGIIKSGADLGDVKSYCAEGWYLVAEHGFLVGETDMLLLRVARPGDQPALFEDPTWNGSTVVVTGKYPAQEIFCDALICECEDYILVDHIEAQ